MCGVSGEGSPAAPLVQWRFLTGWRKRLCSSSVGSSPETSLRAFEKRFHVTVADAEEFFETTPGVLRFEISSGVFEVKATNGVDGEVMVGSRGLASPGPFLGAPAGPRGR